MNISENELKANLEFLKLKTIAENFENVIEKATKNNLSYFDFLSTLIADETITKKEKAIERKVRLAKFPVMKTIADFDWNHAQINRQQIENFLRLKFLEKNENIVFLGNCGLGKTHLAIAIAEKACRKGHNVLFSSAVDIINELILAKEMKLLDKVLKKFTLPKLLVIDELGYLPIDKLGADMLFQVISKRYERGSIILTTNRQYNEWGHIFNNDDIVASAVLDRIMHHCESVVITGESYRMKQAK
ncbi:MAG: IS21-like element helper ATPase IstB [Bacteroidales bacterium]|nr:IS21-like element helper ATPase IstB [Bacteroidales bacterium]